MRAVIIHFNFLPFSHRANSPLKYFQILLIQNFTYRSHSISWITIERACTHHCLQKIQIVLDVSHYFSLCLVIIQIAQPAVVSHSPICQLIDFAIFAFCSMLTGPGGCPIRWINRLSVRDPSIVARLRCSDVRERCLYYMELVGHALQRFVNSCCLSISKLLL
jgi:hypothetical protein